MAPHQQTDKENRYSESARFGPRKENGQQKQALSVLNCNIQNVKNLQPLNPVKKATFTGVAFPFLGVPFPKQESNSRFTADVKANNKFSIFEDTGTCKNKHQALATLPQSLEQSISSLHLWEFVSHPLEDQLSKDSLKVQDPSAVEIDDLDHEEPKVTCFTQFNHHLESNLPNVYIKDIYKYLRDCEERHRPEAHYMRKQADITPGMRSVLIDWLVEVAEEYKFNNETLFLAVSFVDRFLSRMSVVRGKLQLVGTAAMFIASKFEEIYPPNVAGFVHVTDDTYTKKQVLCMERLILRSLAFEIAVPTSHYFLQRFIQLSASSEIVLDLATYLCELSLLETEPYLHHLPSEVGAACVALARLSFDCDIWPSHLCSSTGYSLENLLPCMKHLHSTWLQAPTNPQQAIFKKYKSDRWHAVSFLTPPP